MQLAQRPAMLLPVGRLCSIQAPGSAAALSVAAGHTRAACVSRCGRGSSWRGRIVGRDAAVRRRASAREMRAPAASGPSGTGPSPEPCAAAASTSPSAPRVIGVDQALAAAACGRRRVPESDLDRDPQLVAAYVGFKASAIVWRGSRELERGRPRSRWQKTAGRAPGNLPRFVSGRVLLSWVILTFEASHHPLSVPRAEPGIPRTRAPRPPARPAARS